jgi:DNA repair protein RecO (recombination protein O)
VEWTDEGIVIGVRRHGESSVILDLLTRTHGRHLGFVQGGRSRRLRPCLQPGNSVHAVWRSRIEEQLGSYAIEPATLRAARVMETPLALNAVNHLCALARLLPEREPHDALCAQLEAILGAVDDRHATPAAIVRFELSFLTELGFGLDLESCAATGTREDLVYVSPRTGRAVSRQAGEPYRDRMLVLPAFCRGDVAAAAPAGDVAAGFRLAEFFLLRDVFVPRQQALPDARAAYVRALAAPPTGVSLNG